MENSREANTQDVVVRTVDVAKQYGEGEAAVRARMDGRAFVRTHVGMLAGGSSTGKDLSAAPQTTSTTPRIRITRPMVTITMENTDSPTRRSKNRRSISQP
jgi:hypothetical protein